LEAWPAAGRKRTSNERLSRHPSRMVRHLGPGPVK
jgi:hypothetical protein